MGVFSRLFGTDDTIKKVAGGIIDGVDAVVFTPEEKAENFLSLLKAYEPFKLAQRLLALIMGIPYVIVWMLSALMLVVSAFLDPAYGKQIAEGANTLAELNNATLGQPVAIILAFYFGGGALEGLVRAVEKK